MVRLRIDDGLHRCAPGIDLDDEVGDQHLTAYVELSPDLVLARVYR